MDIMKLKLGSKIMRGMLSKMISKAIYKKFGYKVEVKLEDLDLNFVDGDAKIKTSLEINLDSKEFKKIIKDIDMD